MPAFFVRAKKQRKKGVARCLKQQNFPVFRINLFGSAKKGRAKTKKTKED
jgi:hypothetical protein